MGEGRAGAAHAAPATRSRPATQDLLDYHRELLEASAIGEDAITARGYWTAIKRTQLRDLGFPLTQQLVPALVIPIRDSRGEIVTFQIRPDTPRISEDGRPVKYETPAKTPPALDVPAAAVEALASPITPLWITEGARKADAGVSAGLCCVSLPGVWSWVRRLDGDIRTVIPDLQRVRLDERKVIVAFDSDVMVKASVHQALEALSAYLASQGALVSYCYLPNLEAGVKTGLDDFLATGRTPEDLWSHVSEELRDPPRPRERVTPALPTARLLGYVNNLLRRFVHYPSGGEHQRTALALYVLHTWAIEAAVRTPYLYIKSPQKRSGKTRLLEVLELACRAPLRAASITEAAVFQSIEAFDPTLLIDEVDAIFTARSERAQALRGILNAGAGRGAHVVRGTQDGTPAKFSTFCCKVLAGIDTGRLPDTIRDRSIVIELERKRRDEPVERLRVRDLGNEPEELQQRLRDWAAEHTEVLREYRCELIPGISDRLEEAWEPLLAIAELAGGDWPARARAAAVALAEGDDHGAEDHAQLLLAALQDIFGSREEMFTAEICTKLNEDDELPFGGYRRGEGIDGRGLARLLRRHDIRPHNVRVPEGEQAKGYRREEFLEAWARYATEGGAAQETAVDPSHPSRRPRDTTSGSLEPKSGGTDTETRSVQDPSQPQIAPQSENGSRWDGGTDGTEKQRLLAVRALSGDDGPDALVWDFTRPRGARDTVEAEGAGIAVVQPWSRPARPNGSRHSAATPTTGPLTGSVSAARSSAGSATRQPRGRHEGRLETTPRCSGRQSAARSRTCSKTASCGSRSSNANWGMAELPIEQLREK